MKKIALLLIVANLIFADVIEIKEFQSDLFSKYNTNSLKKMEFSLLFDGRDLKENRYKIVDALNIVTSSFYIEDILTSKGKERFKSTLKKYVAKKYAVDIDDVFIQKISIKDSVSVDAFIKALRDEGYCKENPTKLKKNIFEDVEIDN